MSTRNADCDTSCMAFPIHSRFNYPWYIHARVSMDDDRSQDELASSSDIELNSADITSQRVGHLENLLLRTDLSSEKESTQV